MTKDEAFEKWNTPHWVNEDGKRFDMSFAEKAFNAGWQAAKQQSAGEIAELKATIEELRYMQGINTDFAISELKADNEKLEISLTSLREALASMVDMCITHIGSDYNAEIHTRYAKAKQVLATTPAQSMKDNV